MLRSRHLVPRTPWHVLFAQMLVELGSPAFDVQTEVELLRRPARADLVILRRRAPARAGGARILHRLWTWLKDVAVVEFKSHNAPLAPGDLLCWLAISQLFWGLRLAKYRGIRVQAVLVVVRRTPTLTAEAAHAGFELRDEGNGYFALRGAVPEAKIVVLDEVARAEREPLLGLFSGATLSELRVQRWFHEHAGKVIESMGTKLTRANPDFLKNFIASLPAKQLLAGLTVEQRLAGVDPELRLAGLDPKQRLAGLDPKQRLAGLDPKQRLAGLDPKQRLAGLNLKQRLAGLNLKQRLAGLDPDEIAQAVASLPAKTRRSVVARLSTPASKSAPRSGKRAVRSAAPVSKTASRKGKRAPRPIKKK